MEAKILRVESDFVLVELKSNGKQLPIDFDKLSEKDVEFLQNYDEDAVAPQAGTKDAETPEEEPETGRLYPRTKEEIRAGIRDFARQERPEGISM